MASAWVVHCARFFGWCDHRRLRWAVNAYVDGVLPPAETAGVRAHLADCWPCSVEAELSRLVKATLRRHAIGAGEELALRRVRRRVVRLLHS